MNISIIADLHLSSKEEHPERYNALENILDKSVEHEAGALIIAGDLFDKNFSNYSEFEKYCGQNAYSDIQIYIVPGNHDPQLKAKEFTTDNIHIMDQPEVIPLGESARQFLFVPYLEGVSMGEVIADFDSMLKTGRWVLVGHGDYMEGIKEPNPYEQGIYMPLTRKDVTQFKPVQVFLGHIHKPYEKGKVRYPGSPCPITVSETGIRSFLLYNTESNSMEQHTVDADILYFALSVTVLPVEDEEEFVTSQIREKLDGLQLSEAEKKKAQLRLRVRGYTQDKNSLAKIIEKTVKDYTLVEEDGLDLSEVHSTDKSSERIELVDRVKDYIDELDWPEDGALSPGKEDIIVQAMKSILEV